MTTWAPAPLPPRPLMKSPCPCGRQGVPLHLQGLGHRSDQRGGLLLHLSGRHPR